MEDSPFRLRGGVLKCPKLLRGRTGRSCTRCCEFCATFAQARCGPAHNGLDDLPSLHGVLPVQHLPELENHEEERRTHHQFFYHVSDDGKTMQHQLSDKFVRLFRIIQVWDFQFRLEPGIFFRLKVRIYTFPTSAFRAQYLGYRIRIHTACG